MVLRWLLGLPGDEEDSDNLEVVDDAEELPWWEKVSHSDPDVRTQGHKEALQEREVNVRYDRD